MNRRRFLRLALAAGLVALWPAPTLRAAAPGAWSRRLPGPTARFMAVGDLMMHAPVTAAGLQPNGAYDFKAFFEYVRPFFQEADVLLGNLETPLAGAEAKFTGYPNFNAPDELAADLAWAGFSILNLANNHALDRGAKGLLRTMETVEAAGLAYVGAYKNPADRAAPRLLKTAGGLLGFLSYTYGANGYRPPAGQGWLLNFIDRDLILADLADLKAAGPDFIIVSLHFGLEYQRRPNDLQKNLVEALFDAGVDLVIGHHPHVVQPMVSRAGPEGEKAAVFSLGNFFSNQQQPHTDQGLIFETALGFDHKGRKVLGPALLRATRCLRCLRDGRRTYRVVPVLEALADPGAYGLSEAERAELAAGRAELARHLLQ